MPTATNTLIALDVGARRIGVAVARSDVRIARPLITLERSTDIFEQLSRLIIEHQTSHIVIGLPRGLDGQVTTQTTASEAFATELARQLPISVSLQDEALTSKQAETELSTRRKPYTKADIDALAATYILEDYMREHYKDGNV